MGQHEEILTLAYGVLDTHADDPGGYIAAKIASAEAAHDSEAVQKWRRVRQAMAPLLRQSLRTRVRSGAARPGSAR
jgi:hypothetical protein